MDRPLSRHRRLWFRYGSAIVLGAVAVSAAAGLTVLASQRGADAIVYLDQITTAVADLGPIAETAAFIAEVVPKDLIQVDSSEGGRVARIYVATGDMVRKGQELLRLENAEREALISSRISQIRADLNALRAQESQIAQARLVDRKAVLEASYALQKARTDLAHRLILAEKGILGPAHIAPNREEVAFHERVLAETRQTQTANETIRAAQLASLTEQARDLDQNLFSARTQLADFVIVAPRDGMVLGLTVKPGATIAPGTQVASLDPRQGLILEAQLDQYYVNRVQVGMMAYTMGRDAGTLQVHHVSPDVRDGTFRIELILADGSAGTLKAGETVQGRLVLQSSERAITIPNGPFMGTANGRYVFVLSADGHEAERRNIRTGVRTPEQVAVLEGLNKGDRVIVSAYDDFTDVQRIGIR